MNVAILSSTDLIGGAARSAYRLHQGLQQIGVTSRMVVQRKSSDAPTVYSPTQAVQKGLAPIRRHLDALPVRHYPQRQPALFSPAWLPDGLRGRVAAQTPNIINLHWVGHGFLQIETLPRFRQPLVWTLHDMWAFTGGCHYSGGCNRYTQRCGACPHLGSDRDRDLSRQIWQRKQQAWRQQSITIVTPSRWMADCVRASSLLGQQRLEVIPYGLDLTQYKPIAKPLARQILNLPPDRRLILFVALSATSDTRKGFHLLQPALERLSQTGWQDQLELVVVGASQPPPTANFGFPTHYLGSFSDDVALALAYAAADVFVAPSLEDNLPNTVLEAIACGTPCVAFAIGGMPDLIDHQRNGFLARPFLPADLAEGIAWVLQSDRHPQLAAQARQKAEQEFPLQRQAERYQALYTELLDSKASQPSASQP